MKRKFAIMTSGGDAPGMNAAIRSIVRVAAAFGHSVLGIQRGYQGLLARDIHPIGPRDVSKILERGGTILRTARCEEMRTPAGVKKAASILESLNVDVLFVIGGDGSMRGCMELSKYWRGQVLGLPGTIDNDLWGTDYTIGFDTAVNTALNAIEKIRDTADSHGRFFLVEVMGRHSGAIALEVAITCGAEDFLVPEVPFDIEDVHKRLLAAKALGKTGSMLVVAEGAYPGGVHALARKLGILGKDNDDEYRLCVLGHIQRGGSPSAADRLLATRLGAYAVEAALAGEDGKMVGESYGRPMLVDFTQACNLKKALDPWTLQMAPCLSEAGPPRTEGLPPSRFRKGAGVRPRTRAKAPPTREKQAAPAREKHSEKRAA